MPPHVTNPMDYEFFINVVRSDDETNNQAEWQRLKTRLAAAPVTPSLHLEDLAKKTEDVDLQLYLAPSHFKLMGTQLSVIQLSTLVTSEWYTI